MQSVAETTQPVRRADVESAAGMDVARACPFCESRATKEYLRAPDWFHLRQKVYKLMRCAECDCVWLADPPAPADMGKHYTEDYHRVIAKGGETAAETRWQTHRELISKYKSGGSILDIGCSSGAFLGTLPKSWKLFGIEMERATAEKARAATGAEVFVGDVMDAPFASASFDAVTCFDLLEHVYNPRAFLSRVFEWLKPGGIVFIMLPNIDSWEARTLGSYWYGLELPRHLFHFSPRSMRQVMRSLGFEEVSVSTPSTSYLERSASYLSGAMLQKVGIPPVPMSKERRRSFLSRAVRKALRTAVFEPLGTIASWAGAGASMQAVFAKPPSSATDKS